MGGVSYNFYAWANGPGAGRSDMLPNGQRDWSTPGGKYGVAQLSNKLLWAPDGLNMAQSLNGEMLGYGYIPLPLTEPIANTNGTMSKRAINAGPFFEFHQLQRACNLLFTHFLDRTRIAGSSLEGLFSGLKTL
jgi:hypothetical protein